MRIVTPSAKIHRSNRITGSAGARLLYVLFRIVRERIERLGHGERVIEFPLCIFSGAKDGADIARSHQYV